LGCGNDIKTGWINVDCYPPQSQSGCEILVLDVRGKLPFADKSVVAIYSEHFIEHLPLDIVRLHLLPECIRILSAGGYIRMGVPDGEWLLRSYCDPMCGEVTDAIFRRLCGGRNPMVLVNEMTHGSSHHYLYDYETLEIIFGEAGFVDLHKSRANDSSIPYFHRLDQVDESRVATTVYIEGRRP
jgi:predicted SAM-dependent methyltransferase